jgi:hypothetical protein
VSERDKLEKDILKEKSLLKRLLARTMLRLADVFDAWSDKHARGEKVPPPTSGDSK